MKRRKCVILCLAVCILVSGCSKEREPEKGRYGIYYLDTDGDGLTEELCDIKGDSPEENIKQVLEFMEDEPDSIDYKSVLIQGVKVQDWELNETKLDIYLNNKYYRLEQSSRLLLRAAMVQSLVQVPGVDYVRFFVGGETMVDDNGEEYGYMHADDFVQNTGSSLHSSQEAELILYFSNQKGDKLAEEKVHVRYNSNMSVEKLIVEQLLKGPSTSKVKATIPQGTRLLGVSVKDNVCYVNFDEGFLQVANQVNPKLTIYSIVNSVIDGGTSGQVQILINGESDIKYQETLDLSKPFSRNGNIIEAEEE